MYSLGFSFDRNCQFRFLFVKNLDGVPISVTHCLNLEELKILLKDISLKLKYCMLWNTNEIILNGTESKHKTKTIL